MISSQDPIRSAIYKLVSSILPHDDLEKKHIEFTKDWIESGAELFRTKAPNYPAIHLVSYFMINDPIANQWLLVDHKRACLWLPPGGHVEPNEHPTETVKREAMEELKIEAEFLLQDPLFLTVCFIGDDQFPHTDVSLWYVLKGNQQENLLFDPHEFHQIRWFSSQEIPENRTDPHLHRFLDKTTKVLDVGVALGV